MIILSFMQEECPENVGRFVAQFTELRIAKPFVTVTHPEFILSKFTSQSSCQELLLVVSMLSASAKMEDASIVGQSVQLEEPQHLKNYCRRNC